ncbi:MAG: PaaI family thioesterase [Aquabacterium sp.]|uniref:PaaI family thioesterase n=1 Tax=Aquabacterium sp. TaxID=1872578 RepID=UPI003BD673C4
MAIPFPIVSPFVEQLGCELQRCDGGVAEITLALGPAHANAFGVAHGGIVMTLLDVAMAHAARSLRPEALGQALGIVTIEMKTTFMRPGQGLLRATGQVMHSTASMAFCEGKVVDEKGQLCAHATASFKYMRAMPVTGRQALAQGGALLSGPGSD